MRIKWNERTIADKFLTIFRLIASVAAFIFACLQLFKIYDSAINIAVPLMGLAFLLQAMMKALLSIHHRISMFTNIYLLKKIQRL